MWATGISKRRSPDARTVIQGTCLSPQPSTPNDEIHLVNIPLAIFSHVFFFLPKSVILSEDNDQKLL